MTREQLLALLRDAVGYIFHDDACAWTTRQSYSERYGWTPGTCNCGQRELMVRVEDALATERTEPMFCGNPNCGYMMMPSICTKCGWVLPKSRNDQ